MIEIFIMKVRTIAGGFGAPLQLVVTLWLCLRGVWTRRWFVIIKMEPISWSSNLVFFMRKIESSNPPTSVTCLAWSGPRAAMATGLLPYQRSPPHPPLLPGEYLEYLDWLWSTSLLSSIVCNLRLSRLQNVRLKSWDELCWHWFRGLLQLPFLIATLLFRVSISMKEMGCPPKNFGLKKQVGSFAFLWAYLHYYTFIPLSLLVLTNLVILYQEQHKSRCLQWKVWT